MALRPGGDFLHYDPELMTVGTYTGYETQIVGGINYSRKYNDNDAWTVGAEYFYNHPGYSSASVYPRPCSTPSATRTRCPTRSRCFRSSIWASTTAALFASFPAPYSWNYTTFTLSTLGNLSDKSFISRVDYSVTVLTHLSFEAFLGVHYGHVGGEFRFELPSSLAVPARRRPRQLPGRRPGRRAAHQDLSAAWSRSADAADNVMRTPVPTHHVRVWTWT